MKQKTVKYLVVGPLAYRMASDYRLEVSEEYAHFFRDTPPAQKDGVKVVVECDLLVADGDVRIDGQLAYRDPVRSVFVNAQGRETRVFDLEGKTYAVCCEATVSDQQDKPRDEGQNDVQVSLQLILAKYCLSEGNIIVNTYILEAMMMEKMMLLCKGLILHSSFIVHQGKSILFTAPSGTGKSTQAALWERYAEAEIINGDRSVVWYDEASQRFMSSGLPFCGSSGINKVRTVPLGAVVFIEQSPSNSAVAQPESVAARKLFGEMSINKWNPRFVECSLDLINMLAESVPMVHLLCNMEEDAVATLREYMAHKDINDNNDFNDINGINDINGTNDINGINGPKSSNSHG